VEVEEELNYLPHIVYDNGKVLRGSNDEEGIKCIHSVDDGSLDCISLGNRLQAFDYCLYFLN